MDLLIMRTCKFGGVEFDKGYCIVFWMVFLIGLFCGLFIGAIA